MIFYDFEVFKYDWLVVLVNPDKRSVDVIVNDKDDLQSFYDANKDEIWVGKNNVHYDQYILKGILCGFDPKKVNDFIIEKGKAGYMFSSMFREIPMYNYDVGFPTNSLKQLEGFMGGKIKQTSVPFDVDRPLTQDELDEEIEYCKHDVFNAMEVFMRSKSEFDAILSLITTFDLPLSYISKTKAQISAIILGCERKDWDDEFDIQFVPTLRMGKYQFIKDWFADKNNHNYEKSFSCMVANTPHDFGWGGVHGAKKNYHTKG
jgi:DNA polymerase